MEEKRVPLTSSVPWWIVFVACLLSGVMLILGGFQLGYFSFNQTVVKEEETTDDPIKLQGLEAGDLITSPLEIKGSIESGWMFEGTFLVRLLDADRKEITATTAKETVPGSWANEGWVEFSAQLIFTPVKGSGYLVFQKDNPSGLSENEESFELPITM